jgi:hypothetical protein
MDDEYAENGEILKCVYRDVYLIKLHNGKTTRRHASQMRLFERVMLDARSTNETNVCMIVVVLM